MFTKLKNFNIATTTNVIERQHHVRLNIRHQKDKQMRTKVNKAHDTKQS